MDNFDFASVMMDDVGDSREERVFRMYVLCSTVLCNGCVLLSLRCS